MKILVTGNKGYIGIVLVEMLLQKSYEVTGYDTDYYKYCDLTEHTCPAKQITKDIRDISIEDLDGIDAVIHLAGLSNDPLGELSPELTNIINYKASVKLAKFAKKVGVKRFVYASSQSMYGISDADSELDEDNSEKNPITAYAHAKWFVENELKKLDDDNFVTVCMRPSTVFGVSPRLRCDIVFNNLVAGQSFNVGIPNGNYSIRNLAEVAQRAVPGSTLAFTGEHGNDARTYRVSFARILSVLKDYYKPEWDLDRGGAELTQFIKMINFTEEQFKGRVCNRLKQINYLLNSKELGRNLFWNT